MGNCAIIGPPIADEVCWYWSEYGGWDGHSYNPRSTEGMAEHAEGN